MRRVVAVAAVIAVVAGAAPRVAATPRPATGPVQPSTVIGVFTSLGGDYQPFAGDFNGDGRDDVFLYAPGAAQDYVEYGTTTRGSFTQVAVSVFNRYQPFVGDFNGD